MKFPKIKTIICILLFAVIFGFVIQPVAAENGTITIGYRGSGAGYIGETFIFDGINTFGNTTLIRVTGPGLPKDGVPAYDFTGTPGTGTSVEVSAEGRWKYTWYSANVPGIDKIQSGRYTFTAFDAQDPTHTATAVLQLKKPEYSISVSPNPSSYGDYIQLEGIAETGITSAKIEITDSSGAVLHVFTSPVSSSGSLSYSFHSDLQPGQYSVTVSNPALKAPFRTMMTVVREGATPAVVTTAAAAVPPVITAAEITEAPTQVSTTKKLSSTVALEPATILAGLIIACALFLVTKRK
jgi:hypothetical protein